VIDWTYEALSSVRKILDYERNQWDSYYKKCHRRHRVDEIGKGSSQIMEESRRKSEK